MPAFLPGCGPPSLATVSRGELPGMRFSRTRAPLGKWCPCRALEIVRGNGLHDITVNEAGTRLDGRCQGSAPTIL